jgi:hypothetical protein
MFLHSGNLLQSESKSVDHEHTFSNIYVIDLAELECDDK